MHTRISTDGSFFFNGMVASQTPFMADLMIQRLCMIAAGYVSCAVQLFVSEGA